MITVYWIKLHFEILFVLPKPKHISRTTYQSNPRVIHPNQRSWLMQRTFTGSKSSWGCLLSSNVSSLLIQEAGSLGATNPFRHSVCVWQCVTVLSVWQILSVIVLEELNQSALSKELRSIEWKTCFVWVFFFFCKTIFLPWKILLIFLSIMFILIRSSSDTIVKSRSNMSAKMT